MTKDSGWIYYNTGDQGHFDKIVYCDKGVDACYIDDHTREQIWSFIPWTSIRKITYDNDCKLLNQGNLRK